MRQASFYATAAAGVCLVVLPLTVLAQETGGPGDATMFTASVRACLVAPGQSDCAAKSQLLTDCAVDMDYARCAALFDAPASVFQNPAWMLAAQLMLAEYSVAMAATEVGADESHDTTVPELVGHAAPEGFQIPPDPVRELNAQQRNELAGLMADPEVAAAVARFGDIQFANRGDGGEQAEYPQALFALQRAQGVEGQSQEETGPLEVIEGAVDAADIRRSHDDFSDRPTLAFDARSPQARVSGADRAGLGLLSRLAVGMQIDGDRIIARTAERLVLDRDDADPVLWRDDDAILRDAASLRWIERYPDGSTLTRLQRADGSWTISIRDATGRALWRERIMADGTSAALIDDLGVGIPVDLSSLPGTSLRELRMTGRADTGLVMALLHEAEIQARGLGRSFSLRQIREVRELRELLPVLGPVQIAFEVNRASVSIEEAQNLFPVGQLIERLITDNPRELFLIEGHTDGTGPAAYNLLLSDRRAESVALALSESFAIPPENLVIQGYGERHLRIPTADAEAGNRRVAIRRISPLLGQ